MSSGISRKTKERYELILELIRTPMTVTEIAVNFDVFKSQLDRDFKSLKESGCVVECGKRVIKGCKASAIYKATGKPYVHDMASRSKQYEAMKIKEPGPTPTIAGATVYGMQNPKLEAAYKAQTALMRSEYKSPKAHVSGSSLGMF